MEERVLVKDVENSVEAGPMVGSVTPAPAHQLKQQQRMRTVLQFSKKIKFTNQ